MTTYSFAAATALALLTAVGQPAVAHSPQDGLAAFERRIAEYVELHRLAAAAFPPPRLTSDGEEIHRATARLAAAIKTARPGARCGDVVAPAAAGLIRATIAEVVARNEYDTAVMLQALRREQRHRDRVPVVNERFPWELEQVPVSFLLWDLPPLPPELQYRLIERDLILLDVDADLVVDIVPNALPLP
jgi:hypothetical protein